MSKKNIIRTHTGRVIVKDDIQHAFSTIKAILKNAGFKCETSLTGVNTKQGSIECLFQLLAEADKLPNTVSQAQIIEENAERAVSILLKINKAKIIRHLCVASGIFFALGYTIGKMM